MVITMSESEKKSKLFAVIRIRGRTSLSPDIERTLELLKLTRKNHMALVRETPSTQGMLQKVKDFVTWGEISIETLERVLEKRGLLVGNKRLTNDYLKESTPFKNVKELAKMIYNGKVELKHLKFMKPIFRLTPPSGGFKGSIKKSFKTKGELGYRGEAINELILKMI